MILKSLKEYSYSNLVEHEIGIIRLKVSKLKNLNLRIIQYFLLFIISLSLPACFQTNYFKNDLNLSGKHTVVVMPEQACAEKDNGRNLFDQATLHKSHKECYYK